MSKEPIIVIVGPTASGKTDLGIRIAKKIHGEIISADSRMIYRNIPIGTATPSKREQKGIPHHCIGIADPKKTFTAEAFARVARKTVTDILKRDKMPVVVGGTGFYINALLYDQSIPNVPPNQKLRVALERKTEKQLFALLKKRDPRRARTIDQHNKRRLIRALEIIHATGTSIPTLTRVPRYKTFILGLHPPKELLHKKIAKRARFMVQKGLIRETKKLLQNNVSKKRIRELGFEYQLPLDYIEGNITKKNLLERLEIETRHYAKRQIMWFKRDKTIRWFTNSKEAFQAFREAL